MEELLKEKLELKAKLFTIEEILKGNIEEFIIKIIETNLVIIKDNGYDKLINKEFIKSLNLTNYSIWEHNNELLIIFDINTIDCVYIVIYTTVTIDLNINNWIDKQKEYIKTHNINKNYEVN